MNTDNTGLNDIKITEEITKAKSLREAAKELGYKTTWARKQATRLNIRSKYPRGAERLSDDEMVANTLRLGKSVNSVAKVLGVVPARIVEKASELGIDPRQKVRIGLPEDDILCELIRNCESYAALARQYGVPDHTIRNQVRRLQVQRGGPPRPPTLPKIELLDHDAQQKLAKENDEHRALFEIALNDHKKAAQRCEELVIQKKYLQYELKRLKDDSVSVQDPKVRPEINLESVLIEAQASGNVIILPKAITEAEKSTFDLDRLRAGLLLLGTSYIDYRTGKITQKEFQSALKNSRFKEAPSLSQYGDLSRLGYFGTWNGEIFLLDRHLKWGVVPNRLIRIYFNFVVAKAIVVVGWMPSHLPTDDFS